ncbi:dynein light chain Tctex-type 1-like [Argiope bruennichi]|uniref:dynein light chain Tctex-type 1-like n=1 Tax=Argiope bruennichi TaxID=94029 RepID=UPI00249532F4|nr:dynein light chain Tctex-type 1-like [Argiope bruennichi]
MARTLQVMSFFIGTRSEIVTLVCSDNWSQKDSDENVYEGFVRKAIREVLWGKTYDHHKLMQWIDDLLRKILDQLADFRIEKYLVLCNVQSKCGAGENIAVSLHWDAETDVSSTVRWENDSMVCVVQVISMQMLYGSVSAKED